MKMVNSILFYGPKATFFTQEVGRVRVQPVPEGPGLAVRGKKVQKVTGFLKPVMDFTDKGLQLSHSQMVGCNSLYG